MPSFSRSFRHLPGVFKCFSIWFLAALLSMSAARAEAMLQLFNVNWDELIQKIPEIAEAGYTSLWLPPPTKGGGGVSVGYDPFDPFDLGDQSQKGTVRTRYGTKAELLRVVETAHRFGLRVYFDNIMNHRGFEVPGYDANSPTNLYPGLVPEDFHLRINAQGFYRNWDSVSDWNDVWQVQNRPLLGLLDLAQENPNANFGATEGGTRVKPVFIRQPNHPEYYPDSSLPAIAGPWRPFNGTNGVPAAEDTAAYLTRSVMWLLNETRCDGFRLDAVKHVPGYFFGDYNSATPNGYTGGIQTMYDYVHGYGNNVTGNGYVEPDDNRNSNYDAEAIRNDALIFGEHLGEPPGHDDYFSRGMRLLDNPLRNNLNGILGNPGATLAGYDQRDYGGFSAGIRVMHAQSHDNAYANRRELQNAYYFMREGVPLIYSDGYNLAQTCNGCGDPFPRNAYAPFLGQYGDNKMPDLAWLHHQLARGGTRPRWSDNDVVAFERYDYREGGTAADQTIVLFAMNDNYGFPGDISFDDGVAQTTAGTYYDCFPVDNTRGQGLVVDFPPGTVLAQWADAPGKSRACPRLLVRKATNSRSEADSTRNHADPIERKVYVGSQTLAPGGGAIEFKIPGGGYVLYGYDWPEASPASGRDAITFRHGGIEVPRLMVYRLDGRDGDPGFNPIYPFKMRGSIDPAGNVIRGQNVSNLSYAIEIPMVTNAPFDLVVRVDASANNVLVKLDGGMDLNSQMGFGPTSGFDKRDNRPGYSFDMLVGYEQARFNYRRGPEKFGSTNITNNAVVSSGAETYQYTIGGASTVIAGTGGGADVDTETADWVHHHPANAVTGGSNPPATQRVPLNPGAGQSAEVWVKVGYQFRINTGWMYTTTNGSNPDGAFGAGRGTTQVIALNFDHTESQADGVVDWWRGAIPGQPAGTTVKYRVALYKDGINPVSDANTDKLWGVTQLRITNFVPQTATVWLHNNLNTNHTVTGLAEGVHVVRARAFLPRSGKASVFNTFVQTFYYDSQPPDGAIAFPATNGETLRSQQYGVVVRADSTTTEVEYNLSDSNPANDDAVTGLNHGNGLSNGVPVFAHAQRVLPDASLSQPYPSLPLEYRFSYLAIPSGGSATLTVRLKEATTAVLPNRFRLLTRTVNTLAPAQTLEVAFPATDGQTLQLGPNDGYTLVFRFSDTLTNDIEAFRILIDDAEQPRRKPDGTPLYYFQDQTAGDGKSELRFDWAGMSPGQHTMEVLFNGHGLALQATRLVNVQFVGVSANIVQPPAADAQGRMPFTIEVPTTNGVPFGNQFVITAETDPGVTNVFISFTPATNSFSGGAAVRDTNFVGNGLRWDFRWTNLVPGDFTIRADALGSASNTVVRSVRVVFVPVDFALIAPVRSGGSFSFSFPTQNGRTYLVEYTDSLTNPGWQPLPNVAGDGSVKTVTDAAATVAQRFYRVRGL